MTSNSLAHAWGLHTNPNPNPSPPSAEDMLLNEILLSRWGAHHMANSFALVPSSETRMHNEGLLPMYDWVRTSVGLLKDALTAKGITVPQFPDIPKDWKQENKIDSKTLKAALFPYMAKDIQDYAEHMITVAKSGKHHWTSLVAPMVVLCQVTIDTVAATKIPAGTTSTPTSFSEVVVGDKSLQLHKEHLLSDDHVKHVAVMQEELMRIRSEAGQAGWNEEEAQELCGTHIGIFRKYFVV